MAPAVAEEVINFLSFSSVGMPLRSKRWYAHPVSLTTVGMVAIITLHQAGWLRPIESAAIVAFHPIQRMMMFAGNGISGWWEQRQTAVGLQRENLWLNTERQRLAVENQQLKQRLREAALLKEQADFLRQRNLTFVNAYVVGKDLSQEAQVIVIDRGQRSGIRVGLPVIVQQGILIGRVVEVGEEHAKVMLLTDGRSTAAAALDRSGDVMGVVSGEFGVNLKFDLVPKDQALATGDLVVTSGQEAAIPRGLLVGTVSRVTSTPSQFFHVAYLRPLVSYQTLSVAAVLLTREP